MIRLRNACVLGFAVSIGVFGVACSDDTAAPTESVGEVSSALRKVVTVALPRFAPFSDVVVGAVGGDVSINDRARLRGGPALPGVELSPVVAAEREVKVGVQALVGAVISREKVTLRNNSHSKSVTTSAFIDPQYLGLADIREENANLSGTDSISMAFDFADVSQGNRESATRGPVVDLAPNRYGNVSLLGFSQMRLRTGNYRMASLALQPDSSLVLDNSAGPIVVLVDSSFTFRGKVTLTAPTLSNVLFIYDGTEMVSVEAPFRGTLIAVNARINVDSPYARGRIHQGAFFGFDVIIHQDQVVEHRAFRTTPPVCDVANFTEIENFPHDRSRDVDNDIQGVTLSDSRWYFTNANAQLCGFPIPYKCTLSHIWSFGLNEDIGADVYDLKGNPWQGTYNHFGDLDFVKARPGFGDLLYVALEAAPGGNGGRPAIGFIAPDLSLHFGFAKLGQAPLKEADQTGSAPWVTFNSANNDNRFYSVPFNSAWLNAYDVRRAADGSIEAPHSRNVRFHDCATGTPAIVSRMQGADFSDTGKLYIAVDVQGGGVIVVDPQTGTIRDFMPINFDPNGSDHELEGVVVRNLDGGIKPDGHVHVLMIQNEDSNDDLYFKHLRADDFSKL